jgi:protein TonB
MTSMVVHAAIILGAVVGTTQAAPSVQTIEILDPVIYKAPPPAPPVPRTERNDGSSGAATAEPTRTIPVPTITPIGIPPVNTLDPIGPNTQVVIGLGPSGPAEGGFKGGQSYGEPGADGTWNEHTVEFPVVPDAHNPSPSYPEPLRAARVTGRVLAEFVVDSTGRVRPGSLVIVSSDHELFASSVRRTVPSFRFTPARVQGRRVAQRVRVPFEFEIE